jgi:hypothetical protein
VSRFETEGDWEEQFQSFESALALWEHNVDASIKGKRGQKVLRELEAALEALPERRLIYGALATREGDVCAIGALAKAKGVLPVALISRHEYETLGPNEDWTESVDAGKRCGMTGVLAWAVGSLNDVDLGHVDPEARYWAVLKWVRKNLQP